MPLILSSLDVLVRIVYQFVLNVQYCTDDTIIPRMSTAGGLAVYMHADFVKTMISPTAKYRAFADAGYVSIALSYYYHTLILCVCRYFLDMPNINGSTGFAESFMWRK